MLSEYELRVLRDFEDDFAKDRSRAVASRWMWVALAFVLVAVVLAGCLTGVLVGAAAGAISASAVVVAGAATAWFLHRRRRATR